MKSIIYGLALDFLCLICLLAVLGPEELTAIQTVAGGVLLAIMRREPWRKSDTKMVGIHVGRDGDALVFTPFVQDESAGGQ